MNEAFELKGCVRKLEQRKQRKENKQESHDRLGHIRDFASFDAEFSPSGRLVLETRYTCGGSVHRRPRFEYDETGRLVRTASVDGAGHKLGSSELTYPESYCVWVNCDACGSVTNHGVDEYDGSHLLSTSTFDKQNRRTRVKRFEYSDRRLVKSDSEYYLPDGNACERWLADFDSEGRLRRTYNLKAGLPEYSCEYDQLGRPGKTRRFGDNTPTNMTIYEYVNDEMGNWIERHEFHPSRDDSYQPKGLTTRTLAYY